tara:strand:+ start:20 stop:322 length:303 start_codon:yes stop_codon:yes gene_type:complete
MSAIFKALANLPKREPKKHFVTVDGKEIEVALEKKLEMMRHGFDQYMMEDGKIVLKPVPKIKSKFKKLVDVDKGYHFIDDDIHWPEKIDKGGKAWRIEYE